MSTDSRRPRQGLADRLMGIEKECARRAPRDWLTRDFDRELYDDRGLPRELEAASETSSGDCEKPA